MASRAGFPTDGYGGGGLPCRVGIRVSFGWFTKAVRPPLPGRFLMAFGIDGQKITKNEQIVRNVSLSRQIIKKLLQEIEILYKILKMGKCWNTIYSDFERRLFFQSGRKQGCGIRENGLSDLWRRCFWRSD